MEEYSLKENLDVLLHSTFEYHSVLAENTFEYLAIEFPFKANHPWDRWLAGPLSLTLRLLVASQLLNFSTFVFFQFNRLLSILWSKYSEMEKFLLGGRERACCLRCKMEFSEVEVNWKLFKGNTTPILTRPDRQPPSPRHLQAKKKTKFFYGWERGLNGQLYEVRASTKLLWEKSRLSLNRGESCLSPFHRARGCKYEEWKCRKVTPDLLCQWYSFFRVFNMT